MPNFNISSCSHGTLENESLSKNPNFNKLSDEDVVSVSQPTQGAVVAARSLVTTTLLKLKRGLLKKIKLNPTPSSSRVEDAKEAVTEDKNFTELCLMVKKIIDPDSTFRLGESYIQKNICSSNDDIESLRGLIPEPLIKELQLKGSFYAMLKWLSEFYVDDKNKNLIKCVLEKILPDNNLSINTFSNFNKIIAQIPYEFKKNEYF